MVVHDEESLEEALLLAAQGPVRFSDLYSYISVTSPKALEYNVRRAFDRGDIAIVCPLGQEYSMEIHSAELTKVKARRREEEKKAVKEYFAEHPERVEKIKVHAEKKGQLEKRKEED